MHEQAEGDVRPDGKAAGKTGGIPNGVIIFAIVAVASLIFIAQNREKVTIHFLFIDVTARVWIGFVICLVAGALLGTLLGRWWRKRQEK